MNYEEKYKDALERAKNLIALYPQDAPGYREVFPELAESEDERIRKALIEVFKKKLERGFEWVEYGIPNRSVLAWLEKQKEQKPADLSEMMVHKEPYIAPVPTPMVADEQKAEWSEEDKTIIDCAVEVIEKAGFPSLAVSLKSLRPSWKPSEEQIKALQNAVALTACDKELVRLYNQLKKL